MEYAIKQLADLAGVTTRTLRWYHKEGLLKPLGATGAGYRLYGPREVDRLQQILFYRELGLELSAIRGLLDDPHFDRETALQSHLTALEERRVRLDSLILTVQKTLKGGHKMSDREKFEGFQEKALRENEAKYGVEIREKYGVETVKASNKKFQNLTHQELEAMTALGEEIQEKLEQAVTDGKNPAGFDGAEIAALHRRWLSYTWSSYSPEAHAGLGEMYVADERFTAHYDKALPGCAAFLRDAIAQYVKTV